MKGYMSSLDTPRFDEDKIAHHRLSVYNQGITKATLYNVFYDVTLSPNQVLDSIWLRKQLSGTDPFTWPYTFTIEEEFIHTDKPYTNQLLYWFRRPGGFLYSSKADNVNLKKTLIGVAQGMNHASDEDAVKEMRGYIEEIVEWAEELDVAKGKCQPRPFLANTNFRNVASEFLASSQKERDGASDSRTVSYDVHDEVIARGEEPLMKRSEIDFVSNFQYAVNTDARFVLEEREDNGKDNGKDKGMTIFYGELLPDEKKYFLRIRNKELLASLPEIEKAILGLSTTEISKAITAASEQSRIGWLHMEDGNHDDAVRSFAGALKTFASRLTDEVKEDAIVFFEAPEPSDVLQLPKVGTNASVLLRNLRLHTKWRTVGFDHFVEIDKLN